METHEARKRLVGLSKDSAGHNTVYNPAVTYYCGQCNASTIFDIHTKTSRADLISAFQQTTGKLKSYEEDYCDFDCGGCGAHVRCVYSLTELSMAHYEYYPITLHVRPSTGQPSIEVKRRSQKSKTGCFLLVLGLVFTLLSAALL